MLLRVPQTSLSKALKSSFFHITAAATSKERVKTKLAIITVAATTFLLFAGASGAALLLSSDKSLLPSATPLLDIPTTSRMFLLAATTLAAALLSGFGFGTGLKNDDELFKLHADGVPHRDISGYWANDDPSVPRVIRPFQHARQPGSLTFSGASFNTSCLGILWSNRVGIRGTITFALAITFVWFAESLIGLTSLQTIASIFGANCVSFLALNSLHWLRHVRPERHWDELRQRAKDGLVEPYLARDFNVEKHSDRPNTTVWRTTKFTADLVLKRGFALDGKSLTQHLYDLVTYAMEFKIRKMCTMIAIDLGISGGGKLCGESVFDTIFNCSLGCWIDASTESLVFCDTILPHNSTDLKWYRKIELDLDFKKKTVGTMRLEPYVSHEELMEKSRGEEGKAAVAIDVISTDNLEEICAILGHIGGLKTHPCVHAFANGVGEISDEEWCSATEAHHCTQGFNNAAVFAIPDTQGLRTSPTWVSLIIGRNVAEEGIPTHASLHKLAEEHSVLHRMSRACRVNLRKVLPDLHPCKREAIIQATVMHAADHYYFAEKLPFTGGSEILNSSFYMALAVLVRPVHYHCRSLLCKERQSYDPVSKALYEACAEHDKVFADSGLTIGVLV